MNTNLSLFVKIQIIYRTIFKVLRGFLKKPFLKESSGLLFIGPNVCIQNGQYIKVGRNVKFEANSEIQGLSTNYIHLADNVTIGRQTMIRPSSYYGVGKIGCGLYIGNNSSIGPFGYIGCAGKVNIGSDVMIGPRVSFFAENHNFSKMDIDIKQQGVTNIGIIIDDNCWVGSGAIILDGVHLEHGSIVAAGAVVTKSFPENVVIGGVPAKILKIRK